jgi:hypothetical protein
MTSSVEVFDTATLKPIETHSFGVMLGSLTWVDRHEGAWWAVFANYDREFPPREGLADEPYGESFRTVFVKMDDDWQVEQGWIFPEEVIDRARPMSISGGSWGPDGLLYVSGHDHAEVYTMRIPQAGSILERIETLPVNIEGQGIAWDRSADAKGLLYGIARATEEVVVSQLEGYVEQEGEENGKKDSGSGSSGCSVPSPGMLLFVPLFWGSHFFRKWRTRNGIPKDPRADCVHEIFLRGLLKRTKPF